MYIDISQRANIYQRLFQIDLELAEQKRAEGCPYCQGPLHFANYYREPRGGPPDADEWNLRHGLCCGWCRRRTLPPSARFFGRKVYWGVIVLVVMALRQSNSTSRSASRLRTLFGVSWQTVRRWRQYFAEVFPQSPWWLRLRDRVSPEVRNDGLPSNLLQLFVTECGGAEKGLVACLRFLADGRLART